MQVFARSRLDAVQKVGLATDPRIQLAALQSASPLSLMLHVAVAVPFEEAHALERRAHPVLAGCRSGGERFETTPALVVAAVRAAAEQPGRLAA